VQGEGVGEEKGERKNVKERRIGGGKGRREAKGEARLANRGRGNLAFGFTFVLK